MRALLKITAMAITASLLTQCAGSGVAGNENGSDPINQSEIPLYQKAVTRCHKNGGSRVVKIDGKLRCF